MPTFFLGLLLMLVFSVWLGWLPLSGKDTWLHYILPAITLSTASIAIISRIMHASLIEVLNEDYVRTARAKGQREVAGDLAPCGAQRAHSGGDGRGAAARLPARRRGGDRDGVRLARARAAAGAVDPGARLSGGAGRRAAARHHLRRHQPAHRPDLRPARSEDHRCDERARASPATARRASRCGSCAARGSRCRGSRSCWCSCSAASSRR